MPSIREARNEVIALRDIRQAKAGDIARQLALAGLGLIWIFKKETPSGDLLIDRTLIVAGLLIILALAVDLFQVVGSALVMDQVLSWLNKRGRSGEEISVEISYPKSWVDFLLISFYLKFALLAIAYLALLSFLAVQLF